MATYDISQFEPEVKPPRYDISQFEPEEKPQRGVFGAFGAGFASEVGNVSRAAGSVVGLPSLEQFGTETRDEFAPTAEEADSIPLSVARGLGSLTADLPLIIGTAALLPEVAVGAGVASLALRGVAAMSPVAFSSGINTAKDLKEAGVDEGTAATAGISNAVTTAAMGAIPLSMTGNILKRAITGAVSGVALGEVQRVAQNKVLDEYPEMGVDFTSTEAVSMGVVNAVMGALLGPRPLKTAIANAHASAERDVSSGEPAAEPAQPEFELTPSKPDDTALSEADKAGFARMSEEINRRAEQAAAIEAGQQEVPFPVDLEGVDLSHLDQNTVLADKLAQAQKEAEIDKAHSLNEGGQTVLKALESARAWNIKRAQDQVAAVESGEVLPTAMPTRAATEGIASAVKEADAKVPRKLLAQLRQGVKSADEFAGRLRAKADEFDTTGKRTTDAGTLHAVADHIKPREAGETSPAPKEAPKATPAAPKAARQRVTPLERRVAPEVAEATPNTEAGAVAKDALSKAPEPLVESPYQAYERSIAEGKPLSRVDKPKGEDLGTNIKVEAARQDEINALHAEALRLDAAGDTEGAQRTAQRAMMNIIEGGADYQKYLKEEASDKAGDAFASRTAETVKNPAGEANVRAVAEELLGSKAAVDKHVVFVTDPVTQLPKGVLRQLKLDDANKFTTVAFAHDGKMYVFPDRVTAGSERAVILHEVGVHLGMKNMLGAARVKTLSKQVRKWAESGRETPEAALARQALESVEIAKTEAAHVEQETIAYFVQHAVEAGINPAALKGRQTNGMLAWLQRVWESMKTAVAKLHLDPDTLTAQEIVDIAHASAVSHAEGLPPIEGVAQTTPAGRDVLYGRAAEVVGNSGRASVSLLQRNLRVGRTRAVSLLQELKDDGLIGAEGVNGTHQIIKPEILRSARALDAEAGPNQAVAATDAVMVKAAGLWDGTIKPALRKTHLRWSQMTHIADVTDHLIPKLDSWEADTKNPIREKVDGMLAAAAMAKTLNHRTRQIADSVDALAPKQKEALFALMGKHQLAKIFPNRPLAEHTWLAPHERAQYRQAKQLYDQPGVADVYNAVSTHNRHMHDAGMAALLKGMGHIYGAPEHLWKKVNALDGMGKDVDALKGWIAAHGDPDLKAHFTTALAMHEVKKHESYFHLGRDGDYMVHFRVKDTPEAHAAIQAALTQAGVADKIVVNPGDTRVFSKFETSNEMLAVEKQLATLAKDGHLEGEYIAGKVVERLAALDSSAPSFIRGMLAKIDADVHLDAAQKAEHQELLRRLYIEMLPETSVSKFYARRAGVPGYSSDMHRNFVKRGAAAAYFVSQNATRADQSAAMARLREATAEMGRSDSKHFSPINNEYATDVINELNLRTANILTPLRTPAIDILGAMGHTFFLSASPSFIIQNLAQPYQLTLPYLGGRHGFRASSVAMGAAARDVAAILKDTVGEGWKVGENAKSRWMGVLDASITVERSKLNPTDKRAMKALIASGRADWTQGGELSRIEEGANPKIETALKSANLMSYYGEALNRMQSGLAAFRLELKRTGNEAKALDYMIRTIDDTQINYSTENRARAIGKFGVFGKVTPLVFAFQQFNLGVMQMLGKLTLQATRSGATATERREAVKSLGGLMATTGIAAGTMGLPFAGAITGAYNAFMSSENEPVDAEADYQNFLSDMIGQDAAQVVAHGAMNYLTGADVAGKLGQDNLIPFTQLASRLLDSRAPMKERLNSGALQFMGPVVNGGAGILQGIDKMADGHLMKGLAQALPSAFKGAVKAVDIASNGFTDSRGKPLPLEATTWDSIVQTGGFTPAKLAKQREAQRGVDVILRALQTRAADLGNKFAAAVEAKDIQARLDVMAEIAAFRRKNPTITVNLSGAVRRRAKEQALAVASGVGVKVSARRIPFAQEQARFAAEQP